MEGSIADSTALRMRAQLQRMHHSCPTSGPDGFLEELLKMPAAQVSEPHDQPEVNDAALDAAPTSASAKPDEKPKSSKDDSRDKDEPTDDPLIAPNLQICYAPMQTAQEPVADQPDADTATTTVISDVASTPVAATEVAPSSDAPVVAVDESPVVEDAATQVTTPAVEDDTIVQPIDNNLASQVKDKPVKGARDLRRAAEGRKEPDVQLRQPQQVGNDSAAETQAQTKPIDTRPQQASEEPAKDKVQPAVAPDPNQPTAVAESKRDSDDARGERDKWYEKPANGDDPSTNLVDRLQEESTDRKDNDAANPATPQGNATSPVDPNAASVDTSALLADASSQAGADNTQVFSDMAAAAEASLAQSANAQTVGQSTGASGSDVSGRGRQSSGAANITGTAGIGQANGSLAGRTGATSTAASSSSKETSEGAREITQQERVRLVQRVARSFSRLGPEGGQVTLKLHPPQLGVLNVSIKIEGQAMTARMQTETGAARDAIVENLSVLRDRLKEQGIEIEKFQVEVGQQEDLSSGAGQSGTFFSGGNNSQQGEPSASTDYDLRRVARGSASRSASLAAPVLEPKLQTWPATDRTLDVRA